MKPYFTFTSKKQYNNLLQKILHSYSDLIQDIIDDVCIQEQFIQFNQISVWLKDEILPQFDIHTRNQNMAFSLCSNLIENQLFGVFEEEIQSEIFEIRKILMFLLHFGNYPLYIRTPQLFDKYPPLSNLLDYIRRILFEKCEDDSDPIDFRFISNNIFQIYMKLALKSMETNQEFHNLLGYELNLLSQSDNSSLLLSSIPPKICCEDSTIGAEFKSNIDSIKALFEENHALSENLIQGFNDVDQMFHSFSNDFIEFAYELFPFETIIPILTELRYKFFFWQPEKEPKIHFNSIESLYEYYDNLKMKIILSNGSLKKDLEDRIQIEKQLLFNLDEPNIQSSETEGIFNQLKVFQDIINVFENFKVLERSIVQINSLRHIFSDQGAYNQSLSIYINLLSFDKQIDVLYNMIDEKYKEIEELKEEKKIVEQTTELIEQNLKDLDEEKDKVVECPICRFERKYVLTSCGHTFCDNCYQHYICLLAPENRFCPVCQEPFSFDDILKIQWTNDNSG